MLFLEFCALISSQDRLLEYFQNQGLLQRSLTCAKCGVSMSVQGQSRAMDGLCFRCPKCKSQRSIRHGSFIENSNLSLQTFAVFLYFHHIEVLQKHIAEILGLSEKAVGDYSNLLREQYGQSLIEKGEMLGGPGIEVQVFCFFIRDR